jgi:heavy metal sensor kinase
MTFRSLRVQLSLLFVAFTLVSMSCLGLFSYWYLGRALAGSRRQTMKGREERIVAFINTWPQRDTSSTFSEKMRRMSMTFSESDPIQVYDLNGTVLYSSPSPEIYKVGWPGKPCIEPCYGLVRKGGHELRTLNHVVLLDGRMVRLSIAGVIDEHYEILRMVRDSYLICCPLLLLASMAGGIALSHRALEPIHRITNEARTIGIQDLQHRLPVPQTGDELQLLAETWNDLLGRLDTAVNRLTQFTSDISHDLRTTITVMLTTAGFALRKQRSEEDYRAALNTIAVECDTTCQLLEDLLAAARADIVKKNIEWNSVNISGVVREVCEHLRTGAVVKRQSLQSRLCIEAWTMGDLSMLRRMVTILVDNAIKYTSEGGAIEVSVEACGDRFVIQVMDTGIGIPAESLPQVFDRFYRVDGSRSHEDGGSGLGLAIAKWIAEAHLSTIQVTSSPGDGSTFTVSMPLHSPGSGEEAPHQRAVAI